MDEAERTAEGFAGMQPAAILGADSARAVSMRSSTPVAHAFAWLGSFLGIGIGAFILTDLCPPKFHGWLIVLISIALAVAAISMTSRWWLKEQLRYRVFQFSAFAALGVFAAIIALGPNGAPVVLVVSIGFPLQVSHMFKRRDLEFYVGAWTLLAVAALVIGLSGELTAAEVIPLWVSVVPITWIVCAIFFQLSEARFAAIDRAGLQALRDSQTGLANRRGLEVVGAAMLETESVAGLLLIDLDDFKSANTLYGHPGGDAVIAAVSSELRRRAGDSDLAVRLGGDEFVVVLSRIRGESIADERAAYERAITQLGPEVEMPGFRLSASTGTAELGPDGASVEELLHVAEAGLERSKRGKPAAPPMDTSAASRRPAPRPAFTSATVDLWHAFPVHSDAVVLRRPAGAAVAGLVLLASSPLTDSSPAARIALAAIAAAMFVGALVGHLGLLRRASWRVVAVAGDAVYPAIAAIAWLTGGAIGPALPMLYLAIAYDARNAATPTMMRRLALAELAALSPLLYFSAGTQLEQQLTIGVIAAVAVTLPIMVGLLLRFRFQIVDAHARAEDLARRDALTGALNRSAFEQLASAAIDAGERCAIVMIDLDNFKRVNTEDGYAGGDAVLAAIGGQLTAATREDDAIGRVGGDEFAALLRDVLAIDLEDAAERFIEAVGVAAGRYDSAAARAVGASCGIAIHPDHGSDLTTLMHAADAALMHVKHSGKSAARILPESSKRSSRREG
ncbi:MAG: GGDEF domain-containing protein [Solirubrobacterales bacterium]